jgi:hypothetical protein
LKTPKTTIDPNYIVNILSEHELAEYKSTSKIVFTGNQPSIEIITKSKKGNQWQMASLTFQTNNSTINIKVDEMQGKWLHGLLEKISIQNQSIFTMQEVKDDYTNAGLEDFELFWDNKPVNQLYKAGVIML